jgi:hypothetical protein
MSTSTALGSSLPASEQPLDGLVLAARGTTPLHPGLMGNMMMMMTTPLLAVLLLLAAPRA